MKGESKNHKLLGAFAKYCKEYPEQRFWQALRNWSGQAFIGATDTGHLNDPDFKDTFYWEHKDH